MNENVAKFFELYMSDEVLRQRVADAEAAYPGSLEIRDALVEAVLLPIAAEYGLGFTVKDLRAYETKLKMERFRDGENGGEIDLAKSEIPYWLVDRGWTYDEANFCGGEGLK